MAEASEELARFESAIDLVDAIAWKISRELVFDMGRTVQSSRGSGGTTPQH